MAPMREASLASARPGPTGAGPARCAQPRRPRPPTPPTIPPRTPPPPTAKSNERAPATDRGRREDIATSLMRRFAGGTLFVVWRLRQPGQMPLIIGHRGASACETENTVAAFRRARADGADGVELD